MSTLLIIGISLNIVASVWDAYLNPGPLRPLKVHGVRAFEMFLYYGSLLVVLFSAEKLLLKIIIVIGLHFILCPLISTVFNKTRNKSNV
jgi:hypothetical protein